MTPNLYAEIDSAGEVGRIIMPSKDGVTLPAAPRGPHWYGVQWPLNPHNTGERCIRLMLAAGFPGRVPA